jgi:excisionase family DNA binding protein
MDDFLSTNDAAERLGVSRQRVLQLIEAGRLPAMKFANVYMIRTDDLKQVEDRPQGRPPKQPAEPTTTKKRGAKK